MEPWDPVAFRLLFGPKSNEQLVSKAPAANSKMPNVCACWEG